MKFDEKPSRKELKGYGTIMTAAFSVVLTILLGGGLGYLLDWLFDTKFLMVVGFVLFTIIAIVNFFRTLMRIK